MSKELEHETALTMKELMSAVRSYLVKQRPTLPDLSKDIVCTIEVKGQDIAIFKWGVVKDKKKELDRILGIEE